MNEKICTAKRCVEIVDTFMCSYHWGLVPSKLKDKMIETYVPGQTENVRLKTSTWTRLVLDARRIVMHEEQKLEKM